VFILPFGNTYLQMPQGVPQMVEVQMASPGGTVRRQNVPLVQYVDPNTGQTYITLHTNTNTINGLFGF
jgi:hypothetical protein